VFYSNPADIEQEPKKDTKDEVEKLNQELKVSMFLIGVSEAIVV
jgi:isopentenyl diphosphate isomerase/L-lactate dehydrogenase-like FMN-dependent dehydrogenase